MTRLSNNIKEAIWKQLCERAFQKEAQALVDEMSVFAIRVHATSFSEKDRAKMEGLPPGWLPQKERIQVKLAGKMETFHFRGTGDDWGLSEYLRQAGAKTHEVSLRLPNRLVDGCVAVFERGDPICEDWDALKAKKDDLVKRISDAKHSALAVMNSASTVKRLISIWPEAEEFAKKYLVEGERRAMLPMVPVDRLNTLLKLPPNAQETIQ